MAVEHLAVSPTLRASADPNPRLLFYSHDGFGLGHLRRNLKLAARLVRELPEASALLVAGLPGTPELELPPGVDLVKLPTIRKVATDQWRPRQLRLDSERLRAIRGSLLDAVFGSFAPHLVVVDYLPLGVWSELRRPLVRLRREHPEAAVVLGLRDVLDAPLVTLRTWRAGGHDQAVRTLFDAVHVYGDRELYDTQCVYGLDGLAPGRIAFTGYVCGELEVGDVDGERTRLALAPREELVLVTAGGGADAFPMMRLAVLACLRLAARGRPVRGLVVTGPLMGAVEFAELERLAAGHRIEIRRWRSGLATTMAAADVVLTMAAYNTLTEALSLGRRVIAIPRPGPSAEQTTRARLFAERGLLETLPADSTPERLASVLASALARPRGGGRLPAMDGLTNGAARLRSLLDRAVRSERCLGRGEGRLA